MATWVYWNDTSASSSSSCTADNTWYTWTSTDCTSSATTDTWYHWDNKPYSVYTFNPVDFLTEHYENMQREINRIWNKMLADWLKEEKEAAEATARALLLDLVSQKEFDLYEKTGRLLVKGRRNSYIVKKEGGVITVKGKNVMEGMCVHLNYNDKKKCPETDNVIAMKIHIEQAEKAFLRTANHHGERPARNDELEFLKAVNE